MEELKNRFLKARLYLVMDAASRQGRTYLETAEEALKGGVDILQLRDYSLSDSQLLKTALRMGNLAHRHQTLFIVNNRPDIAKLSGADGVHLGQEDLPLAEARKILGPGKIIGVSTHALVEAKKAVADGADYIGVGPVFATPTKAGRTPVGLDYIRQVVELNCPVPFFAIGGIDLSNVGQVVEAGASRVAVVRAIAEAKDPKKAAQDFKKALEQGQALPSRP